MVLLSSITITLTPFNVSLSTRFSARIAGRDGNAASHGIKHYGTDSPFFSVCRPHPAHASEWRKRTRALPSQRPFTPANPAQTLLPGFLAGVLFDARHGTHGRHDGVGQGRDAHELPHAHIREGQGNAEAAVRRAHLVVHDINLVRQAGDAFLH